MRPKAIIGFELLFLAAVAIEVGRVAFAWPTFSEAPILRLGGIAVTIALVLLTSRCRSRVARLLLAATFLLGLPIVAQTLQTASGSAAASITLAQIVMQAVALFFLFSPSGRAWFAALPEGGRSGTRSPTPE